MYSIIAYLINATVEEKKCLLEQHAHIQFDFNNSILHSSFMNQRKAHLFSESLNSVIKVEKRESITNIDEVGNINATNVMRFI